MLEKLEKLESKKKTATVTHLIADECRVPDPDGLLPADGDGAAGGVDQLGLGRRPRQLQVRRRRQRRDRRR